MQEAVSVRREEPPTEAAPRSIHVGELLNFAEGIIAAKSKDELWDEKTQRQVRSITDPLVKFLLRDQRVEDLNEVSQENLARFVDFRQADKPPGTKDPPLPRAKKIAKCYRNNMAGLEYSARLGFFSPSITYRIGDDALELQHSRGGDRIAFQQIESVRLYQVRKFGVAGQTSALVWRCQVHARSGRDITLPQDSFARFGKRESRGLSFRFFVNALIARISEQNPEVRVLHEEARRSRTRESSGRLLIQSLNVFRWIKPGYLEAIGGSFLRTVGPWLPEHRVGRANLAMAFPEKSPSEIEQILRGVWDNYGRVCAGILTLDRISPTSYSADESDKIVLSEAARRELAQYRKDRKPRLVFSAHLANWEVQAPVARALGVDLVVPVRMQHLGPVATLLNRARSGGPETYIPISSDATSKLKGAIDRGACVAVMVDQHDAKGINVTFFERACTVNPLFARLVRSLEWPILGLRAIRLPDGRICIDMVGPLEPARDGDGQVDVAATMQTCMRVIEQWVREHPEQWMWLHRLWRDAAKRH